MNAHDIARKLRHEARQALRALVEADQVLPLSAIERIGSEVETLEAMGAEEIELVRARRCGHVTAVCKVERGLDPEWCSACAYQGL